MSDELKLCPFCGGEARIQGYGYSKDDYRVYCKKCECSTIRWSSTKEEAIAAWNKRAPIIDCNTAEKQGNLCCGYGVDDEPIAQCQQCNKYMGREMYETEEQI